MVYIIRLKLNTVIVILKIISTIITLTKLRQTSALMKNWQQMKEVSYVGIKLTKAKSISQGLNRCKMQKLAKKNPVYQHLLKNSRSKKKGSCSAFSITKAKLPFKLTLDRVSQSQTKRSKTQHLDKELLSIEMTPMTDEQPQYGEHFQKIFNQTPRYLAAKKSRTMTQAIDEFQVSFQRTKNNFVRLQAYMDRVQTGFVTAIDDINLEINEDKGMSLRQIKTGQQQIIDDLQEDIRRIRKFQKRIKEIAKPVVFPLTQRQMGSIIQEDSQRKRKSKSKLSRMLASIYDYKASRDYIQRKKMIHNFVNK